MEHDYELFLDTGISKYPFHASSIYTKAHPLFDEVLRFIPKLSLKHRSVLIKVCQAQKVPTSMTPGPLFSMLRDLPSFMIYSGTYRLEHAILQWSSLITSPFLSSLLLDLCRSVPIATTEEVQEAFKESIGKEISLCEEDGLPSMLDFDPIFYQEAQYESILPHIPPNPYMARFFRLALEDWRKRVSSRVHYPRRTDKSMAYDTWKEYCHEMGGHFCSEEANNFPKMMTQKVWLRLYHNTGIQLGGRSEVRCKWYPSSAKPRTYYAMGGLHYQASAHLQDAFTDLVNTNIMTHHRTRLMPSIVRLKFGQHLRIYDFSSFTSRMDTQKIFLRAMADFVRGWEFTYMDVRRGVTTEDFGDVLDRYIQTCCDRPILSYDRVAKRFKMEEGAMHHHNKASMLGIFGNLMTCTFEHAAVVGQTVEDESQGVVAGDDASFAEDQENEHYLDCAACSIGVYERSKSFNTLEPPCIALKRPISQVEGSTIITTGFALIPPSYHLIRQCHDPTFSDPRYIKFDQPTNTDLLNKLGKSLFALLRSTFDRREHLSEDDVISVMTFVRGVTENFRQLGFDVNDDEGRFPTIVPSHTIFWPLVALDYDDFVSRDPVQWLVERWYDGHVFVTLRGKTVYRDRPAAGESFRSNSSKWLALMVDLGYLESEPARVEAYDMEGFLLLIDRFNTTDPVVYDFVCIKDIPEALFEQ